MSEASEDLYATYGDESSDVPSNEELTDPSSLGVVEMDEEIPVFGQSEAEYSLHASCAQRVEEDVVENLRPCAFFAIFSGLSGATLKFEPQAKIKRRRRSKYHVSHHQLGVGFYQCATCRRKYSHKRSLVRHQRAAHY